MFTTVSEENIFPMVKVNGQQVMMTHVYVLFLLFVFSQFILGVGPLFAGPGLLSLQEDPSCQDGKVSLFCHRHSHFLKTIVTRIAFGICCMHACVRIGLHPQLMSFGCESEGIEFTPMSRGSEKLTCQHAFFQAQQCSTVQLLERRRLQYARVSS